MVPGGALWIRAWCGSNRGHWSKILGIAWHALLVSFFFHVSSFLACDAQIPAAETYILPSRLAAAFAPHANVDSYF